MIGGADEFADDAPYRPTVAEWQLLHRLDRSPTDREAMAAVHVLSRMPFIRVGQALDRDGIDFEGLLDMPWSSGERVLIGAAAALWSGDEGVPLADIVTSLDDDNLLVVLEGIALRVGWWDAAAEALGVIGGRQ